MKRYSRKREAILEAIRSTPSHPTAEWVYNELKPQFPDLSLATVYRNIREFVDSGEITSMGIVDSKERFDRNTSPHSHYICVCCGKIFDVMTDGSPELASLRELCPYGTVTECEVTFRGVCADCLAMENAGPEDSENPAE